jgi:predicted small metal-binding protein
MSKILKCGDLMAGCSFVARGETEKEVLQAAAEHAKKAHGLDATPELVEKVKAAIRNA